MINPFCIAQQLDFNQIAALFFNKICTVCECALQTIKQRLENIKQFVTNFMTFFYDKKTSNAL